MLMLGKNAFAVAGLAVEAAPPRRLCLSSLFGTALPETIPAGKAICWEGDPAGCVFQVAEGVVRLQRIIGEGRRVITAFQYAGDIFGAFPQRNYLFTAEAVSDCRIRRIGRNLFLGEIAGSDALRPAYMGLLCKETEAAHEQMVLLSKKNAQERLCSFLIELAPRTEMSGNPGLLQIPMNRQDIADYLGMTIETVSRTISKLAAIQVVVPEGRHNLRIVCRQRLKELCGNADAFNLENCHRLVRHGSTADLC